jgi:hypothetical protein
MAKRSSTRARRTKRVIDLATDEVTVARTGRVPDQRAQETRRALVLRWAQQRRCLDLAQHDR